MSIVKTFNATQSAMVDSLNVNWNDHSGDTAAVSGAKYFLVGFTDDLTGEDRFRAIEAGSFSMFLYGGSGVALRVYELQGAFDEASVTFSRIPQSGYVSIGDLAPDGASGYNAYKSVSVGSRADLPLLFLKYGALLRPYANGGATVDTSRGSHPPQLALTLGAVCGLDSIQIRTSKQAYYGGPYQYFYGLETRIRWIAQCTAPTAQAPRQTSAVLRWRTAPGETEHEISVTGSLNTVTIPANTLPTGSAQVQVTVTADSGVTTTSEWTTLQSAGVGWSVDCSPSSGFVAKTEANTFRWAPVLSYGASGELEQSAAVFRWRPAGGAATSISLTTEQSVTIPAGTFSTDTVEWQVETTINGVTQTSDWMELSTVDALPTATPLAPVGTIVDGSAPITFSWLHEISTGTAPSGADLQVSSDNGSSWAALAHVSGSDTSYIAAAGALSAGNILWRVRSFNSDGVAGAWSAGAQIVVVAAPPAPAVSADASPRPLIFWQASGQQGYELRVDGSLISAEWGAASSYQATEIFSDGTHVIEVRVQNVYGLWSEWGSASIVVANVPGGAILLSAEGGEQAALSWTAAGYEGFWIMRDGARIAVTENFSFSDDRAGAGARRYQIIGLLSGGNFGASAEVEARISIPCPMLLDVRGGTWLRLPTFLQGQAAISDGWAPDVGLVHYSGRGFPTAEVGAGKSRTVTLRPAFPAGQRDAAEALTGLIGKLLFYKDPRGAAFPAVITQLTGETQQQHFAFNLTLEEVDGGTEYA